MIVTILGRIARHSELGQRVSAGTAAEGVIDYTVKQLHKHKIYPGRVDREAACVLTFQIPTGLTWKVGTFYGFRADDNNTIDVRKIVLTNDKSIHDESITIDLQDPDAISKFSQQIPKQSILGRALQTAVLSTMLSIFISQNYIRRTYDLLLSRWMGQRTLD